MKKYFILLVSVVVLFAQSACTSQKCVSQKGKRNIAVQIYSFRNFTVLEGLQHVKKMGVNCVEASPEVRIGGEFKNQKMNLKMSDEAKAYLKKLLADMDMKFVGYGVVKTKTEADVEAYCKLAKEFDIKYILTEDSVAQFKHWQKYGEKYGVTMILHHHAKDSVNQYWHPSIMRMFVGDYSNVMSNPDIGHWARSEVDPIKALRTLRGEIGSIHIKDQAKGVVGTRAPVPMGEGGIDLVGVLRELDCQGYNGYLVIEYETEWDNPVPGITKCVKFLKEN